MAHTVTCPTCGTCEMDVCSYSSMMLVRRDLALFKLECPTCHTVVSTLQPIPLQLREIVRSAAIESGSGMGAEG